MHHTVFVHSFHQRIFYNIYRKRERERENGQFYATFEMSCVSYLVQTLSKAYTNNVREGQRMVYIKIGPTTNKEKQNNTDKFSEKAEIE